MFQNYSALVNTRYVIVDVINVIHPLLSLLSEKPYKHLLIYHPLHVKRLQYDNAIPNTRYERKVFQLRNRKQLSLKFTYGIQDRANLGDKK